MVSREEYSKFCDSIIPAEEIEKYNKQQKKKWIALSISWGIEGLMLIVSLFIQPIICIPVIFLALIVSLIIVATLGYKWDSLKQTYASKILEFLLKDYKHEYSPYQYIAEHIFDASGFGGKHDSYSGEDLFQIDIPNDDGMPSGVKLNICDLNVTRQETRTVTVTLNGHTTTRTETYTVTVYHGLFGYVHFPFEFKCNLSLNTYSLGGNKIKLEDIYFNKRFTTYTDNQMEALCILTPTMMNKLLKFDQLVKGFKLSISKHGAMYFGMSGNLLSLTNIRRKPSGNVFASFYDDIYTILALVNEIKTNNKVFKM